MLLGEFELTILVNTSLQSQTLKRKARLLSSAKDDAMFFGRHGIFEKDEEDPALMHYYPPHTVNEVLIRDMGPEDPDPNRRLSNESPHNID